MEESLYYTDSGVRCKKNYHPNHRIRIQRKFVYNKEHQMSFSIETRARKQQEMGGTYKQFISTASQPAESLLLDEIEKFSSISNRLHKKGRAVNPAYLQAGLLYYGDV